MLSLPPRGSGRAGRSCALRLGLLAVALALAAGGCDDGSTEADRERRRARRAELEEQDTIEGLGYTSYADAEPDPEEGDGVVLRDEERSSPGYDLVVSIPTSRADLLDRKGSVVRSWRDSMHGMWMRCEISPRGDVFVLGRKLAPGDRPPGVNPENPLAADEPLTERAFLSAFVLRLSWDGEILWRRHLPAHHDLGFTPDGDVLVLTQVVRTDVERYGTEPFRDNHVVRLSPEDGATLVEFSILDALGGSAELLASVKADGERREAAAARRARTGGVWGDPIHANSVNWIQAPGLAGQSELYAPGNLVVTLRHLNAIAVLDAGHERVLWHWGAEVLRGPHDGVLLDKGNFLVFDNGYPNRKWSRVLEVDPRTDRPVWQWTAPDRESFFSRIRGTCQRLPNGNTLVGSSVDGEAFEVTPDGEVVWRYLNPHKSDEGARGQIRLVRYTTERIEELEAASGER